MNKRFELIFNAFGQIHDGLPYHREVIYFGRNGNTVERIQITLNHKNYSYIYKKLTNFSSMGREAWVQHNIIPMIPKVRVPRIYLTSNTENPENYWMIMEDIGDLGYNFSVDMMKSAAAAIPHWHVLSKHAVPDEFTGHTPRACQIQDYIISKELQLHTLFSTCGYRSVDVDFIHREIIARPDIEADEVISHGDLNPLNIVYANNKVTIIDWEYIHKNSVYWDLYCLMDITSPMYRRPLLNQKSRLEILSAYTLKRKNLHKPVHASFIYDYHRFCAMYAIWLLLVIEGDRGRNKFKEQDLKLQYAETFEILKVVLNYLIKHRP